jgi:carbonic anhydrase
MAAMANAINLVWEVNEGDIDYSKGGDNWDEGSCLTGSMQSPIDIQIDELDDLKTAYYNRTFTNIQGGNIEHTHDTLDTAYSIGDVDYTIEGKTTHWDTEQFHFHAPSEHKINGKRYEAEMHFRCVLKDDISTYLQFAIMLDEDKDAEDNIFFEQLKINEFNVTDTHSQTLNLTDVNITQLFDQLEGSNILKYEGSRTRPPCQEDTVWLVLRNALKINSRQLKYFTRLWADDLKFAGGRGNNRNLQDRNRRSVYLLTLEDTSKYHWIIVGCAIGFGAIVVVTVSVVCYCRIKKQKIAEEQKKNTRLNQTEALSNDSHHLLFEDQ